MWNRPAAANLSRRIASFGRVDARTVMIVALLFLGSNVLVESVARVTIDPNSGQKASLSASCIWDCGWDMGDINLILMSMVPQKGINCH